MHPNDNTIVVTGTSQTLKQPDSSHLKITVFSRKPTAQDASQSVQRRVDYVLQVLRLHGFDKSNINNRTRLEEENKAQMSANVPDFDARGVNLVNAGGRMTEFVCTSDICAEMEPSSGMSGEVVFQRVWETHNVQ